MIEWMTNDCEHNFNKCSNIIIIVAMVTLQRRTTAIEIIILWNVLC